MPQFNYIIITKKLEREMKNKIANLESRADQMEKKISDRNVDMMQMKEKRDLRVKKVKELYKKDLTPSE